MAGKALLLRAWLDTGSLGGRGYYSPLHEDLGCATLIPIPENAARPAEHLDPSRAIDPCTGRPYAEFQPVERGWLLHHDPRLDLGFYTDYFSPGGRLPRRPGKRLTRGDLLVFLAGLARYPRGFWDRRRSLRDILQAFRRSVEEGGAAVYIVGVLVVEAVVDVARSGWSHAFRVNPLLRASPHYARPGDEPVAVVGRGYLVQPPAPASEASGRLDSMNPSGLLRRLLGDEAAENMARSRYRRSRVVPLTLHGLEEGLGEEGYRLVPIEPRGLEHPL